MFAIRFEQMVPVEVLYSFMASHFGKSQPLSGYSDSIRKCGVVIVLPVEGAYAEERGRTLLYVESHSPAVLQHVTEVLNSWPGCSNINVRWYNGSKGVIPSMSLNFAGESETEVLAKAGNMLARLVEEQQIQLDRFMADLAALREECRAAEACKESAGRELSELASACRKVWMPQSSRRRLEKLSSIFLRY